MSISSAKGLRGSESLRHDDYRGRLQFSEENLTTVLYIHQKTNILSSNFTHPRVTKRRTSLTNAIAEFFMMVHKMKVFAHT